jgi:diguanylate cyclase (GGDEF)-like protein/PAS domain S-box-containing protein
MDDDLNNARPTYPSRFFHEWAILCGILLVLGGFIADSLWLDYRHTEEFEHEQLMQQTKVVEKNLISQLIATNKAIEAVIGEFPAWEAEKDGFKKANQRLRVMDGCLAAVNPIFVINADGTVISSSNEKLIGMNFAQRQYFQTALHNPDPRILHVSAPFKTVLGTFVITLFRSIRGPNGEFAGIVIVGLVPEYFSVLLDSVRYAPDMRSGVVHGDGKLFLMVPERSEALGMDLAAPGSFFTRYRDSGQAASLIIGTDTATGEERMIALRDIQIATPRMDMPLVVVVSRDSSAIFAPWRKSLYVQGILFFLIAISSTLGLWLSQNVRRRQFADRQRADDALRQSDERYRMAFLANTDAIAINHLADGHYLEVNEGFTHLVGWTQGEVIGRTPREIKIWQSANDKRRFVRALRIDGACTNMEANFVAKNGKVITALMSAHVMTIDGKHCVLSVTRDITERKYAEMALRESQDQFRKVFEHSPISMVMIGMDGTIVYINRKMIETFGYGPKDIPTIDRWYAQAYPDETYRANIVALWKGLVMEARKNDGEIAQREYHVTCKNGRVKTAAIFGVWVADQLLTVFEDITERKEAEERIRNLAYFDPLTQLPNRRLAMDRLGQALIASNRKAEYGALMILDLDNFKALNDTQGHDSGDRLLIEVAQRIVECVRAEDTVSRLGGDEYVVMVEGLAADEISAARHTETIAEKIRTALNQPYTFFRDGQAHHSTSSIGVTLFLGNEISIDVLLKQADMALYQAKGAGRNTVRFFNPAMQATIESRSRMEIALRNGLQNAEFQLFYQPQVDNIGNLIGAEALLRWQSAEHGHVSPANFISLAEDTGLIIPLGSWVMQTACAQLRGWADSPTTRDLQISINVSARQFRQEDFVEQVFDALKSSGANPKLLKLELTESVVLENVEDVIIRMQQINALGATFSLDDFGTGFSSLSYLKRLPLEEVKIDQTFIRDITSDPNDAAIVRAIIAMSRSLGIQVIAEGVETEAQLHFLKENGCMKFQGYLFGKPMAIGEWDQIL